MITFISHDQLKKSPRENASWLSIISFAWVWKLLWKGYKTPLEMEDIYQLAPGDKSEHIAEEVLKVWRHHVAQCSILRKEPSLLKVLYSIYGKKFLWNTLLCFLSESFILLAQPVSLAFLLQYLQVPEAGVQDDPDWVEYLSAFGIISTAVWFAITNHILQFQFHHLWTHIRIACSVLIYHKCLCISHNSLGASYVSEALSLMSTDVNRLDELEVFCIYIIIAPVQMILALLVLHYFFGLPALVGVFLIVCYFPFVFILGRFFSRTRVSTNSKKDHRLRILAEIFNCIKEIKMYGWEKYFMQKAAQCRKEELRYVKRTCALRATNSVVSFTITNLLAFLTLLVYVVTNKDSYLTPKLVFAVLNFYANLRFIVTIFFTRGIEDLAEILIVTGRIQRFLLLKETKCQRKKYSIDTCDSLAVDDILVEITDCSIVATTSGSCGSTCPLTNITLELRGNGLVMLIGPGGCGKSALLQAIIGEAPFLTGKVATRGTVVFLSGSDPWVFRGTIEDNILFGLPMRHPWYEQVIDSCAIEEVIDGLPNKDKTKIDSSTISKGYMCRISLARAVYSDSDIYLLDDCMIHIDTHAARRIMDKCIGGILEKKLIIFASTQLQFLEYADRVILFHHGRIRMDGTFGEFRLQESKFLDKRPSLEDDLNVTAESVISFANFDEPITDTRLNDVDDGVMVVRRQAQAPVEPPALNIDDEYLLRAVESTEEMENSMGIRIYKKYMQIGSNCFLTTIFIVICIFTQIILSGSEYWLEKFTKTEEWRHRVFLENSHHPLPDKYRNKDHLYLDFEKHRGAWYYFVLSTNRSTQTIVFGAFTIALVAMSLIRTVMFYGICVTSSTNIYNILMNSLLRAPASLFDINTISRILNRLSQDISGIDDHLPPSLYELLDVVSLIVGTLILVSALSIYFLLPSVTLIVVTCFLQIFHQRTIKSLKRLEGISRGPIMTTLTTTLKGLSTIHSFEQEEMFIQKFYNAMDVHTATWIVFLSTQRWLGFVIGWCSVAYITIVTVTFIGIFNDEHEDPAEVGLGIHSAITLAQLFQWQLRIQAEVDALMVSVERVVEFTDIQPEGDWETKKDFLLPEGWPNMGDIVFQNICVNNSENRCLLQDISFHVSPREKIGVVGHTGCGKTLLLSTLLRIVEPSSGIITIDGKDISKLGLHDLRQKIAVVPAEPEIFLGTVRENYDPFGHHTDAAIWQILTQTYLFDTIKSLPMGLDTELDDEASQFTLGQKQLLCLGRAMMNGSHIVVCDINPESDELIQDIILENFQHCTVIASAHQLHSAIEFEKLIVLEDGHLCDFDEPYNLLQKKSGAFFNLIQHCGSSTVKTLKELAKEAKANRGKRKTESMQQRKSVRLFSTWKKQYSL